MESQEDESFCLICYEVLTEVYCFNVIENEHEKTVCDKEHWFCKTCAEDYFKKKQICPYCLRPAKGYRKDKIASYYAKKFHDTLQEHINRLTEDEKNHREEFIKSKQLEAQFRMQIFEKEREDLMKLNDSLKTQLSQLENEYESLSRNKTSEIQSLQHEIFTKETLLEKEKRYLLELQKSNLHNEGEMNELKQKIQQLQSVIQDDSIKKDQLQQENEQIKSKMKADRMEIINQILSKNNTKINTPKKSNIINVVDEYDQDDSQNGTVQTLIGTICSYLPTPIISSFARSKSKDFTKYKLLERKGSRKNGLVNKAIDGSNDYVALKLIKKVEQTLKSTIVTPVIPTISNLSSSLFSYTGLGNLSSSITGISSLSTLSSISNLTSLTSSLSSNLTSLWAQNGDDYTIYREAMLLYKLDHDCILTSISFLRSPSGSIYIEMPYFEFDIEFLRWERKLDTKLIMKNLLQGISYLHANAIVHRSLTPSSLLTTDKDISTMVIGSLSKAISLHSIVQNPNFIPENLAYSAPELLYLSPSQIPTEQWDKVDVWSVGCIFAFLLAGRNLFPGVNQKQFLSSILNVKNCRPSTLDRLPSDTSQLVRETRAQTSFEELLPSATPAELDFLTCLLQFDPEKRIPSHMALHHRYFSDKDLDEMSYSAIHNIIPSSGLSNEITDRCITQFVEDVLT